jgi:uracil phosphoribosyltransferase
MKQVLLTTLRNKKTSIADFRRAAHQISLLLASELASKLEKKTITVTTPFSKTKGAALKHDVVLSSILRSSLAMTPAFLEFFPRAKIGFLGLKRDERTAIAKKYYENLPRLRAKETVIIPDPMLATGGSAIHAIRELKKWGIKENNIIFVCIIAAPEGVKALKKSFPQITLITGVIDQKLTPNKFIYPGLGDFGDRYFGTM